MSAKLACGAALWYNGRVKIVVAGGACDTPAGIHLTGDVPMDTLPPHAQDGNTPEKTCTGPCGRILPASAEYFHHAKDRKSGLEAQCKECKSNRQKAHLSRPEAKERRKAYFNRPDIRERESARNKRYHNDPEVRPQYLAYHKENNKRPERKAQILAYSHRPEVRERKIAYLRTYHKRPEVRSRYNGPENRAQWRANAHTYRARKKSVKGVHTVAQIQEQLKRQHHKCYYCSRRFQRVKGLYVYHVDHTFPLSRVADTDIPANDISYLVLACPHCNDSKGDKFPWEWHEGGRLL